MKIKSIYIDGLHNAVNKTYNFGDIAYIFGNNGVGKSTILQAIQFALLGYIPGTAKNSKEALLRHSPTGEIDVNLTLVDNNNDEVLLKRRINKLGNKLSTHPEDYDVTSIISDIEIPIFNFNDFVGQTANKLKEYFIKNILPTADGNLDWEKILAESIEDCNFDDRDEMIKYGMSLLEDLNGDMLDQLIAANGRFKEEQTFVKSESQRLQNTIDSLIYYDDYTGPTDLRELNSELLSLNAIRDQLIRYNSAIEATRAATQELDRLNKDIELLGGQKFYDECTNSLPKLKEAYKALSESISNKQNALAALRATDAAADSIIQSKGICPYTKESCKSIQCKIEDLRNESVKRKANNLGLAEEISVDNDSLNKLHMEIRKCESNINDFMTTWNRIISIEKATKDLPLKPNTDKSLMELDIEIEALNQSKTKLQANIQYNETIENITKLKYESELRSQALACWVKKTDTNGLQTTVMEKPFEELAATMTSHIQRMYGNTDLKAHFNISSKANSFSFGLIRNNIYIPYDLLSSGEKCLYSLALMICIIDNCKSPLKILLCDDMFDHLDNNAIESTFTTLKNISEIQFIFAGVKECNAAKDCILTV